MHMRSGRRRSQSPSSPAAGAVCAHPATAHGHLLGSACRRGARAKERRLGAPKRAWSRSTKERQAGSFPPFPLAVLSLAGQDAHLASLSAPPAGHWSRRARACGLLEGSARARVQLSKFVSFAALSAALARAHLAALCAPRSVGDGFPSRRRVRGGAPRLGARGRRWGGALCCRRRARGRALRGAVPRGARARCARAAAMGGWGWVKFGLWSASVPPELRMCWRGAAPRQGFSLRATKRGAGERPPGPPLRAPSAIPTFPAGDKYRTSRGSQRPRGRRMSGSAALQQPLPPPATLAVAYVSYGVFGRVTCSVSGVRGGRGCS